MNALPLKGKIARILDSRQVIINIGSLGGVKLGMYFDILDASGQDVLDPGTNELLGSLNRTKAHLKVIQVLDKMSVASTYREVTTDPFSFAQALMMGRFGSTTTTETLKTELNAPEDASEVRVGDSVIQVAGPSDGKDLKLK